MEFFSGCLLKELPLFFNYKILVFIFGFGVIVKVWDLFTFSF